MRTTAAEPLVRPVAQRITDRSPTTPIRADQPRSEQARARLTPCTSSAFSPLAASRETLNVKQLRHPDFKRRGNEIPVRHATRIACLASDRPMRLDADAEAQHQRRRMERTIPAAMTLSRASWDFSDRLALRHFSRLKSSRMHIRHVSLVARSGNTTIGDWQRSHRPICGNQTSMKPWFTGKLRGRTGRARLTFRELIYFPLAARENHVFTGNARALVIRPQLTPRTMLPHPRILQPRFRECTFAQAVYSADVAALLCLRPERYLKIRIASCQSRGAEKSSSYASYVDI